MMIKRTDNKQPWIRPLPERLINKIAAGEVVERPASVVKELTENSLDAKATQVDITVEKSGTKLIKIVDNGCGIAEDQIEIAFSRHATSKISEFHDLDSVVSYGFRGEALPSIASVSRMRMVSRVKEADSGTEILFEGGVLQSKKPVSAPPGTSIEVENLFYNTPARRKFLKSEPTELRHISRVATALAIGKYSIGFGYTANDRLYFKEPAGQALDDRIKALLSPGKELISISGEMGPISVVGAVSLPENSLNNRTGQYLFINGRLIQSPSLSHAFVAGYGELLPRGQFPVGALLITVDPLEVDVNVHPAKTEVRLSQEREVHDSLYRIIKQCLQNDGIIPHIQVPSNDFLTDSKTEFSLNKSSVTLPGIAQRASSNLSFHSQLQDDNLPSSGHSVVPVDLETGEIISVANQAAEQQADGMDVDSDALRFIGRFADLYLIFQRSDELLIIDQHTAHERVLFEETLIKLQAEGMPAQQLLLPVQIDLSPDQFSLFTEAEELLKKSGFDISEFGTRTVRIEAVPVTLSRRSPEKIFIAIINDIANLKKAGYDLIKAMAETIACRSAVMSGDRLSDKEAIGLINSLLKCENMYSCPHGRPTFIKMSKTDLNRQFGRE